MIPIAQAPKSMIFLRPHPTTHPIPSPLSDRSEKSPTPVRLTMPTKTVKARAVLTPVVFTKIEVEKRMIGPYPDMARSMQRATRISGMYKGTASNEERFSESWAKQHPNSHVTSALSLRLAPYTLREHFLSLF
jgi:hypothetical protein